MYPYVRQFIICTRPFTLSVRSERLLLGAVALFAVLYVFRTFTYAVDFQDEGVAGMSAWRIAQGQVPHRDFFEIVPPLSFLPAALAMKLFGPSVLLLRLNAVVLALLLFHATDLLLRQLKAGRLSRALALAYLLPFGVSFWPYPSHHWYATVLQAYSLAFAIRGLESSRSGLFGAAAGLLAGLSAYALQDRGAYFLIATAILIIPTVSRGQAKREMVYGWLAGVLSAVIGGGMPLLALVPAGELWSQLVAFPATQYHSLPGHLLGMGGGIQGIFDLWRDGVTSKARIFYCSLTMNVLILYALPFVSAASLIWAWWKGWGEASKRKLLAAGLAALIGTAAHRWSLTSIAQVGPVPLVILVWCTQLLEEKECKAVLRVVRVVAGLFFFSLITFAVILFHLSSPRYGVPVVAPAGTLRSLAPPDAACYQEAIDAVVRFVPEGEAMFVRGFVPNLSFLSLHPNPTRYNFFIHPHYHSDSQAREVVATLERKGVRFVFSSRIQWGPSLLDTYLKKRFVQLWGNRYFVLLGKRSDPPGSSEEAPRGKQSIR